MKQSVKDLVLAAIFTSIIVVMTFVPFLGYIRMGTVDLTLIHIPVLIGVFFLPKRYAIVLGFVFGLGSMIQALTNQDPLNIPFRNPLVSILPRMLFTLVAAYVIVGFKQIEKRAKNHDIWIFGIIVLITSLGIYYAFQALAGQFDWNKSAMAPISLVVIGGFITAYYALIRTKNRENTLIPSVLLLSTFLHTFLVLISMFLFTRKMVFAELPVDEIFGILLTVALTNSVLESLLAVLIGTPIIVALTQLKNNQ